MEYTKKELGFSSRDELEQLIFTSSDKYDKSLRFAQNQNIHFVLWEVNIEGHHDWSILVRSQDAARFKASYDEFKDIKINLFA